MQNDGAIAQLVEQRTENPCVTGSIPVGTTKQERGCVLHNLAFVLFSCFVKSQTNAASQCCAI